MTGSERLGHQPIQPGCEQFPIRFSLAEAEQLASSKQGESPPLGLVGVEQRPDDRAGRWLHGGIERIGSERIFSLTDSIDWAG